MADTYRELAAQHGGDDPRANRVACAYLWAAGVIELSRTGRERFAEEALTAAARRAPRDLAARLALAILYRRTGRSKELAGVLAEMAALCVHQISRYDVLRELGDLYGNVLGDAGRARAALEEALALRSDDTDVMHALARLYDQARDWGKAIELRRRAAESMTDRPRAAALWLELGQIEEGQRADDGAALAAYLRAAELDPKSVPALQAAARLHRKAGRHVQLLEVLRRERALAMAPDKLLPLTIEIAQLSQQVGEPGDATVAAWRDALSIDRKHETALRGLESAAGQAGRWEVVAEVFRAAPETPANLRALAGALGKLEQWAELAEVQGKLVGVLQGKSERVELCRAQAELYEQRLGDADSAIKVWQRSLQIDPADPGSQRALVRLLEAGGRWRDLAVALERELATVPANDVERQVTLLVRIGELRRIHLGKLPEAAQAFEAVLERRPRFVAALDALEEIYANLSRHKDLLRVVELRVDATDRPDDRAALLARVAAIKEQGGEIDGAIDAYRRAFADTPDSRELFTALEGLGYRAERWEPVMELYAQVIKRVEAGQSRAYRLADLYARRGQVQLQYLGAAADAAASFQRVIELEPDNDDAMAQLEQIYGRDQNWRGLIAAHEGRATATRDLQRRAAGLRIAARTAVTRLAEPAEAARLYAAVLQAAPGDGEALDFLEGHYQAAGTWELLTDVLRARAATATGEAQVALMLRIAQIGEEGLRDDDRAIEHYTRVLAAQPEHKQALDALSRIYESTERWADFVDVTRRQIKITSDRNMKALLYFKCGSVMEAKFGKEDDAIRYYDAAIKTSPACLPAVHGLRDLYLRRRDWPRVIQTLELEVKLWQDDKERAGVFAQIGRIYAEELGEPERALHYYESALAVDPDCVPANKALFDQYFAAGEWDRALPLAQALAQKAMRDGDPETRSEFFRKRGVVAWRTGDPRSAAESIVIALEIKPTNIDALDALGEVARAQPDAYDFASTFRELEKIYRRRDDAGPLQARVMVAQAAFLERDGDLDAADKLYAEAASKSPGDFAIVSAQVDLHIAMRRFGHAVEAFARYLEGSPPPPRDIRTKVLLRLAEIHADFEMDSHKAIRVLNEVLRTDENAAEAYYLLAQEHYALGRFAEARAAIERVIELSAAPGSGGLSPERLARYYYYLGRIIEAAGDGRAAASQYRRAAEYDPGYAPPALALAMRTLDGGDQQAAESLLIDAAHAAMASGGEQAAVPLQRGLARILLVGRDRQAAIEAYRGILAVDPDNSDDRLALAEIYVHEDMPRAIDEAKQVIERDLRHAPAYRLLASYYARSGEVDRAARVLLAMEALGYADDSDRRAAARAMAEQSMAPLRHPLSDDLRRRLLLTDFVASPFGELLDAGAAEFASLFPEPPVGSNLVPAAQEADPAFRVAVADTARLFGVEPEIYLGDSVPRGVVAMNFPRPVVVLDRELMADTESARRYALGWAFELLVGRYALLPMLGRRQRRELGGLLKSLFMAEGERPAVSNEFAARLPRNAIRVMERYQGMARAADPEEWIDGMLSSARRAGLFASDDFAAALRVSARLNGENLGVGAEAIAALGVVICGADLVRFYLSDEYHGLRESLTRAIPTVA
jgi:tetratricopeptide (TPR) repeat protein